jgi:hypothetical protein
MQTVCWSVVLSITNVLLVVLQAIIEFSYSAVPGAAPIKSDIPVAVFVAHPFLELSCTEINFGNVILNRSAEKIVVLKNTGDGPCLWSVVIDDEEGLVQLNPQSGSLQPYHEAYISLVYTPIDVNLMQKRVIFSSPQANTIVVDCFGTVSVARVAMPNLNVDFGVRTINVEHRESIEIANKGTTEMEYRMKPITVEPVFSFSALSGTLPPSAKVSVDIFCHPVHFKVAYSLQYQVCISVRAVGSGSNETPFSPFLTEEGSLSCIGGQAIPELMLTSIPYDDTDPTIVQLVGALSLGFVTMGQDFSDRTALSLTNKGNLPFSFVLKSSSPLISSPPLRAIMDGTALAGSTVVENDTSRFQILPHKGQVLPTQQLSFNILAWCANSGLYQQEYHISCEGWSNSFLVICEAGQPSLEVDHNSMPFGICLLNKRVSKILTFHNAGNYPLRINMNLNPSSSAFSINPTMLRLNLNESCSVEVQFLPQAEIKYQTNLEIEWIGPKKVIPVSGMGGRPKLSLNFAAPEDSLENALAFGDALVHVPQQRRLFLSNIGTLDAIFTISSAPTGPSVGKWDVTINNVEYMKSTHELAPKTEIELDVIASGYKMGLLTAMVTFDSTDAGVIQIPATMYCGTFDISVEPVFDFGDVNIVTKHKRTFVIRNTGDLGAYVDST